jgi:hypothetical protein
MLNPVQWVALKVCIADNFFAVFNLCRFMLGFLALFPFLSVAMIELPPRLDSTENGSHLFYSQKYFDVS